jgi:amino acid adenylation domain-containing protein/thioester reductase-like protein
MPEERAAFVIDDCKARTVLAWDAAHPKQFKNVVKWIDCAALAETISSLPAGIPSVARSAEEAAYLMYTSGSTGTPKGVIVPHQAILRLVINANYIKISVDDCIAHASNPAFDASTFEIWGALLNGARLLIVPQAVVLDTKEFASLLQRESVTILWITAGLFAQYIDALASVFVRLRYLLTGGDVVEPRLVSQVFRNGPPRHFINAYGPTECTTFSSAYSVECAPDNIEALPIGRPISNTQIYILDFQRQIVPIGVVGEMYIGGTGVALGYLNRPELNSERFIRNPFSTNVQSRLYKTGDFARWRPDGNIEFLGRVDQQIKIRGFRVELGEIEAQLLRHPKVKEAAVIAQAGVLGQKRLIACVVSNDRMTPEPHSIAELLHGYLTQVLPDYMVPSGFVSLDHLPLTSNGKVDRLALSKSQQVLHPIREYEAPETHLEKTLATIWQEVLDVPRVGRLDNFFDLGGHSLLALHAMLQLNERIGNLVSIGALYQTSNLAALARRITSECEESDLVDLGQEAVLPENILPMPARVAGSDAHILLTGCTGFIGRFLLRELLSETNATIHCLVRASSVHDAFARVKGTLVRWGLWTESFASRILPIRGDMSAPRLGLSESNFRMIVDRVDSIYHCATSMNHLQTYSMAKLANVDAVRMLLDIATRSRTKCVNYVSTVSVFGLAGESARIVDETSSIDYEKHLSSDGYAASKWVGEKLVLLAAGRGVPCNVFRLGLVGPDAQCGRYDELQREYRILKTALLTGYGVKDYVYALDPVPVDYVARSIAALAVRHRNGGGVFHIASPFSTKRGLFERCNDVAGTSLQLIPHFEWICEMRRLHKEGWLLPAIPLIEFAFGMNQASFDEYLENLRLNSVLIRSSRTQRELDEAGVDASAFDDSLLRKCVHDLFERDPELRLASDTRRVKGGKASIAP